MLWKANMKLRKWSPQQLLSPRLCFCFLPQLITTPYKHILRGGNISAESFSYPLHLRSCVFLQHGRRLWKYAVSNQCQLFLLSCNVQIWWLHELVGCSKTLSKYTQVGFAWNNFGFSVYCRGTDRWQKQMLMLHYSYNRFTGPKPDNPWLALNL